MPRYAPRGHEQVTSSPGGRVVIVVVVLLVACGAFAAGLKIGGQQERGRRGGYLN